MQGLYIVTGRFISELSEMLRIYWLEVAMHIAQRVQVTDSQHYFCSVQPCQIFVEHDLKHKANSSIDLKTLSLTNDISCMLPC